MTDFVHQRHKPPIVLNEQRPLVVACPPMKSNVNLSRIVRAATCCGIQRIIACGNPKIDPKIARDGIEDVNVEVRRTLGPVLTKFKQDDYRIVGLEQTSNSKNIHQYKFQKRTVLVVGHERQGIPPDILQLLDEVVEIPVYGKPFSFNVATATSMVLYEYCRQFPNG